MNVFNQEVETRGATGENRLRSAPYWSSQCRIIIYINLCRFLPVEPCHASGAEVLRHRALLV